METLDLTVGSRHYQVPPSLSVAQETRAYQLASEIGLVGAGVRTLRERADSEAPEALAQDIFHQVLGSGRLCAFVAAFLVEVDTEGKPMPLRTPPDEPLTYWSPEFADALSRRLAATDDPTTKRGVWQVATLAVTAFFGDGGTALGTIQDSSPSPTIPPRIPPDLAPVGSAPSSGSFGSSPMAIPPDSTTS